MQFQSTAQSPTHQPRTQKAEETNHACGWFDSSYELSQGLEVTEDSDTCLLQLWAMALQLSRSIH